MVEKTAGMQHKKKQNLNRAGNMDVDKWRSRQIHMRTKAYFAEQERLFAEEHRDDRDEALLAYVREAALRLGRMPGQAELIGSGYLESRLGDWSELALKLGFRQAGHKRDSESMLYKQEYQRQEKLFVEERKAQKREKQNKRRAGAKKKTPKAAEECKKTEG